MNGRRSKLLQYLECNPTIVETLILCAAGLIGALMLSCAIVVSEVYEKPTPTAAEVRR